MWTRANYTAQADAVKMTRLLRFEESIKDRLILVQQVVHSAGNRDTWDFVCSRTVSTFLILQLLNKQCWKLGLEIT